MFSKGLKSIFHKIIYWIILFHTTPEVLDALPLLAVWGLWGPWSACSKKKYCQEGQQHRRRICVTLEDSAHCVGVSMEARDCPAASCVHACKQSLRNLKELCHQFYQNKTIARWRYLTTTTRIHFDFLLCYLNFSIPHDDDIWLQLPEFISIFCFVI